MPPFNIQTILPLLLIFLLPALSHSRLYQVFSLCRHGARYHERDTWDGNDTKSLWAELTGVGMHQHEKLGQLIRKEYIE